MTEVKARARVPVVKADVRIGIVTDSADALHEVCNRLDMRFAAISLPAGDTNAYSYGTMAGHLAAVACLGGGSVGLVSMTLTAKHMMISFPTITHIALIGATSACPSQDQDLHVGDGIIVMSAIQFDKGVMNAKGDFKNNSNLKGPSRSWQTAVAKFEDAMEKGDNDRANFASYLGADAKRPDVSEPPYHGAKDADGKYTPIQTYKKRLFPKAHLGHVGSSSLIKIDHFETRDTVRDQYKCLCVDSSSAALASLDGSRYLCILGATDYCESKNRKNWTRYSLAVAASMLKAILAMLPTEPIKGVKSSAEMMDLSDDEGMGALYAPFVITPPKGYKLQQFSMISISPRPLDGRAVADRLETTLKPFDIDSNNLRIATAFGNISRHNNLVLSLLDDAGSVGEMKMAELIITVARLFLDQGVEPDMVVVCTGGAGNVDKVKVGNVVLSAQAGIVQFDSGVLTAFGEFKEMLHLNPPGRWMLVGVSKMLSDEYITGQVWSKGIKYPAIDTDVLHRVDNVHVDGSNDCKVCAVKGIVERKLENSRKLHTGVIASGDTELHFALGRDVITNRTKALAICNGLTGLSASEVRFLAIVGIAHYSDGHKNIIRHWEQSAAAGAAGVYHTLCKSMQAKR